MDLFWAILIIAALVIVVFAVLPSFVEKPKPVPKRPERHARVVSSSTVYDPSVDRAMLDSYYEPARNTVPEDYPVKQIGACPYTKPPSTDLPLPDMPLCVVQRSDNMKLV